MDEKMAVRRKLLGSIIAGSGALALGACGGGNDSSADGAVSKRTVVDAATPSTTTVGTAAIQMWYAHEAYPNGVPLSYDWAAAPVIQTPTPPAGFTAATGWGEVQFVAGPGTTAAADIVYIRNFRTYTLNSDDTLTLLQNEGSLDGSLMLPTFADNTSFPTTISNSNGVTQATLDPTKAFQFWPTDRVTIPVGTQGVITACEAKIAMPAGSSGDSNIDRSYILALGADWWLSLSAPWDNFKTNAGAGSGRFVYLTTYWQGFTFTTITNASDALSNTVFSY
jgi:hypothetical protein